MGEESPASAYRNEHRVPVIWVSPSHAKEAKGVLEQVQQLDTQYRMRASQCYPNCIAIPVKSHDGLPQGLLPSFDRGCEFCPYSTKVMGRQRKLAPSSASGAISKHFDSSWTLIEKAIWMTLEDFCTRIDDATRMTWREDLKLVPCKALEIWGDDRTVVLPSTQAWEDTFLISFLQSLLLIGKCSLGDGDKQQLLPCLWKHLCAVHGSSRIVRRGTIDPNSRTRHSGHALVYPPTSISSCASGATLTTGPNSPGWICVTEQGIRQSFDLTQVMFSRGNVSEKIRFGQLVQEGEKVLDMYAGIGYYSLPALIVGKALHVAACEWNPAALQALRYNIQDNRISPDRITIYEGDCRESIRIHALWGMFDRVSLGLLPSSEGGWKTAVAALNHSRGGYLHIHGNVPNAERDTWAKWVCCRLGQYCGGTSHSKHWKVVGIHLEKVKSFAPNISHFVLDVALGPDPPFAALLGERRVGLLGDHDASKNLCQEDFEGEQVAIPSCALSPDGVLSQSWMM